MWRLIGIILVFLISRSLPTDAAQDSCYLKNNERQRAINNLESMKMSLSLIPNQPTLKIMKGLTKNLKKRSIVKLDFHNGSRVHRIGSGTPLFARWSYWPELKNDKIISSIEQRRNHGLVLQERRNPSFSPWGGKRDLSTYKSDPKIRRPARVPFNSWGGKRNVEQIDIIKKPFNSWGGKRSEIIDDIPDIPSDITNSKSLNYHLHQNNPDSIEFDQRDFLMNRLNVLDKKSFINSQRMNYNNNLPRVPFDPWGGKKRDSDEILQDEIIMASSPSTSYYQIQ